MSDLNNQEYIQDRNAKEWGFSVDQSVKNRVKMLHKEKEPETPAR